ncbi:MAG: hypothetical protein NTU61_04655 [Candidatus Altiarchaeota archaeon]|nr:hypothetical protein [Candidatus Altiarchaeota archaeon]
MRQLAFAIIAVILVSGCVDNTKTVYVCPDGTLSEDPLECPKLNFTCNVAEQATASTVTSTTATSTTNTVSTSSTTISAQLESWITQMASGCECTRWKCPTTTSTTSTSTITSTTCVTIPDPTYIPETKRFDMLIRGQRFIPDEITVYEGDLVIVNITNLQGLHRLRETSTGKTITLPPGESHELSFQATQEGRFELTCNPYCDNPMYADINVEKPHYTLC